MKRRRWLLRATAYAIACLLLGACGQTDTTSKGGPPTSASSKAAIPVAISGQVFVVTGGRENIKLALVEVNAIPHVGVAAYLADRKRLASQEQQAFRPTLEAAKGEWLSAEKAADAATKRYIATDSAVTAENHSKETDRFIAAGDRARQKKAAWAKANAHYVSFAQPSYYFAALPASVASAKTDADGRFTLNLPPGQYVLAAATSRKVLRDTEDYFWLIEVDATKPINGLMLSNDNQVETKCKDCVLLPKD